MSLDIGICNADERRVLADMLSDRTLDRYNRTN